MDYYTDKVGPEVKGFLKSAEIWLCLLCNLKVFWKVREKKKKLETKSDSVVVNGVVNTLSDDLLHFTSFIRSDKKATSRRATRNNALWVTVRLHYITSGCMIVIIRPCVRRAPNRTYSNSRWRLCWSVHTELHMMWTEMESWLGGKWEVDARRKGGCHGDFISGIQSVIFSGEGGGMKVRASKPRWIWAEQAMHTNRKWRNLDNWMRLKLFLGEKRFEELWIKVSSSVLKAD